MQELIAVTFGFSRILDVLLTNDTSHITGRKTVIYLYSTEHPNKYLVTEQFKPCSPFWRLSLRQTSRMGSMETNDGAHA